MKQKLILAAPYHDPQGIFNSVFKGYLSELQKYFTICLSITPVTQKANSLFIDYLKNQGVKTYFNDPNSSLADHSRNALKLALKEEGEQQIFFGFIDRILFAISHSEKANFLKDLEETRERNCVLFQRSSKAWMTHPGNYREIEQTVSRMMKILTGITLELNPCAYLLNRKTAGMILGQSLVSDWSVWGEWVLLILKNKVEYNALAVDWLEWEDPFWEETDPPRLRQTRENDPKETLKRLQTNLPIANLLLEKRFAGLVQVGV